MRTFEASREFALEKDNADILAKFKSRFYIKENSIYMDGNSLGLCSKDAEESLLRALASWKENAIEIWNAGYFLYHDDLGAMLASLINADANEVTVCTNTTINIHQALATLYKPTSTRNKILVDDLNFPTDYYAVYSNIALHGYNPEECMKMVPSRDGKLINEDDIIAAMTDDVCMVLLPSVLYRSSQLVDMVRVTKAANERNIIIGWDLCHSIGAVPHDFKSFDADFAVWCNYKYINGGPGAIASIYVNKKHFDKTPGLAGWHGNRKDTQFQLKLRFEHAENAGGWQTGTQPLLAMAPIEGQLKIINEAGMQNIRAKSLDITAYLMYLIDTKLLSYGFGTDNPRDDAVRGGHIALTHEKAFTICEAMRENGIIPDFRYPNVIRLAPSALYVSYEDIYEMVERIIKIMENKEYEKISTNSNNLVV